MKKSLIALAALSGLASTSFAQSSVTVFGIVDAAATSVSNTGVGSIQSLASGGNSTSRFGVRGTEDLGGGMTAGFWLESAIAADTGAAGGNGTVTSPAGQFWDRRSTVSLTHASAGEIRLGRDLVPTYNAWSAADPFSYVGVAASSSLLSQTQATVLNRALGGSANASPLVRVNNMVQYFLPANLGGVYGNVVVSAGEGGTVAAGATKAQGGRLGFATGPVDVSVALLTTKNLPTDNFKDLVVSGSYNFGVVKLAAAHRQFKYLSSKQANTLVSLTAPVGQGTLKASVQRANQSGTTAGGVSIDGNDATEFGLGYVYDLSKRTALYTTVARISNKGAAAFTIGGGPSGMAGGGKSTGYQFGMRHSF